ncbi:MAG: hypothetical protein GWP03_01750 [Proteobacteria bacterium]|nr:hypothetical protein [Pseudomonadota bacterium]
MQDYSSLIRRCKDISLNIFARNTIADDKLLYLGYFKNINVFSYDDILDADSVFEHVIDRISHYSNSKYAFYQFTTIANIPEELLINMLRWITIYDAVFLVNGKKDTIVDFGLISRTFFEKQHTDNFRDSIFIKYIMPFETGVENAVKGVKYFTKSL